MLASRSVPSFDPHPLLRDGHAQTIAGAYLPGRAVRLEAAEHRVGLADGDQLSVWETVPSGWVPAGPAAVVVHGLGGSVRSSCVVRLAARLARMGVRVVRMNLRGAGTGFGLARRTYHAGRTEDLRAVVGWLARRLPGSPIALIGFSLGGNLALKLAAEAADEPIAGLDCVLAASPPVDLAACSAHLRRPAGRIYDGNLLRAVRRAIERHHARFPELGPPGLRRVRTLAELDECYTAPRYGYAGAADYYARSSAAPLMSRIRLHGLVVQAEDDPFIPPEPIRGVQCPVNLALELLPYGGHLGFISRSRWGGDRRWLDARLACWLAERWADRPPPAAGALGAV